MHIETYRDKRGHWRWRLRDANGRVVAIPGEGYVDLRDMAEAMCLALGGDLHQTISGLKLARGGSRLPIEEVVER